MMCALSMLHGRWLNMPATFRARMLRQSDQLYFILPACLVVVEHISTSCTSLLITVRLDSQDVKRWLLKTHFDLLCFYMFECS